MRHDTIDQSQLATHDVSLASLDRAVSTSRAARLIKARHRVNKRQVDAVISDYYRRNISPLKRITAVQYGLSPPVNFN
jgi:DTW domain-containing protein YfiP